MGKIMKKEIMSQINHLTFRDGWIADPETVSKVQELGVLLWKKKRPVCVNKSGRIAKNKHV